MKRPNPIGRQALQERNFERVGGTESVQTQVRILAEGVVESGPLAEPLPADLMPTARFSDDQIRCGLPEPAPFGLRDLRWFD